MIDFFLLNSNQISKEFVEVSSNFNDQTWTIEVISTELFFFKPDREQFSLRES